MGVGGRLDFQHKVLFVGVAVEVRLHQSRWISSCFLSLGRMEADPSSSQGGAACLRRLSRGR